MYLASDELKGRMTGSPEEKLAADYIIKQWQLAGVTNAKKNLKAKKYLQPFSYKIKKDSVTTEMLKGNNVVGHINNKSKFTILIGAHYDHLGMGEGHGSLHSSGPAIHNGADDNASGVAAIIELGRMLKESPYKKYNYTLVAFSGEELGLYGSKWYTNQTIKGRGSINYMLNYDMVGRLDTQNRTLVINGAGTSPAWADAFSKIQGDFQIKTTESGVGPSDHTSFYLKNIPVLHFFSGQHKDYHKPTDDEEKINYQGLEEIIRYSYNLIGFLNERDTIPFIKTKDDVHDNAPKFTVTMGVMPDYTYQGEGMRLDGVTPGKPAANAGLKEGDVVLQLGELSITDMMSYMKALSSFKKGDKTTVIYQRGKEKLSADVQF